MIPAPAGMFGSRKAYSERTLVNSLGLKTSPAAEFYFCGGLSILFFRGPEADARAFEALDVDLGPQVSSPVGRGFVEMWVLRTRHPATATPGDGEAEILGRMLQPVWRGVPIRTALRMGAPAAATGPGEVAEMPFACGITVEAHMPEDPEEGEWKAAVELTLGPPFVPEPKIVTNTAGKDKSFPGDPLPLRLPGGASADGREIVLLVAAAPRAQAALAPPGKNVATPLSLWWEQTARDFPPAGK